MEDSKLHTWVRDQLLEALTEVQRQSCREVPKLNGKSVPLNDLPGFDSLCGVETIVTLEERLGIKLEDVPFVAPESYRPLKVDEIVYYVVTACRNGLAERMSSRLTNAAGGGHE